MTIRNEWNPVETFEDYRLVRRIGRGGMGDVFLAHDTLLDRPVALKFMGQFAPDSHARERFLIEARAVARIQHPNVMAIYRVGELDHRPYLVTEYIHGDTMEALAKPVPWQRALELGIGLSRGLAAAHRRGVLHRDIKPGNVLITEDGHVKLLDFGLAKLLDGSLQEQEPPAQRDSIVIRLAQAAGPATSDPEVNQRAETQPVPLLRASPAASSATDNIPPARHTPAPGPSPRETIVLHTGVRSPNGPSSLTLTGCVVGTPAYVPPELWAGEPATARSEVHALGAVLYELCTGFAPTAGVALDQLPQFLRENNIRPLCTVVPGVDPRFGAVIDRCLLRDPAKRFASADELREALERLAQAADEHAIQEGNPYRGLAAFQAEHRALFFGRDRDCAAILDRLRCEDCVVVAGNSGVGKSSLCLAGVLPRVRDGALGQGRSWTVLQFVPGRHALAAFAEALAQSVVLPRDEIVTRLKTEPDKLVQELRTLWGDAGIVLFVDQLEELFTISDPIEGAIVSRALGRLAAGVAGVRILTVLRSDFLPSITALPGFGDQLCRAAYWLRPLSPDNVREAIVGPAQAKGATFESTELVDVLVQSIADDAGGMPLLELVLAQLWDARDKVADLITAAALAHIGGIAGAIARHADDILLGMPRGQRAAAEKILTALVPVERMQLGQPQAALAAATDSDTRHALHTLVQGRLLVAAGASEGTGYELACGALITGWEALRRLVDEKADSRIVRHRLQMAVTEWERLGRTRDALWGVRQLQETSILDPRDLTPREKQFLETSRRTLRRDRLKHHVMIACMPVAIAVAHGGAPFATPRTIEQQEAASNSVINIALENLVSNSSNNEQATFPPCPATTTAYTKGYGRCR